MCSGAYDTSRRARAAPPPPPLLTRAPHSHRAQEAILGLQHLHDLEEVEQGGQADDDDGGGAQQG